MQMRVATCNIAEFISILPALPLCPWGDAIVCVCVFARMVGSRDQHKESGEGEEKEKRKE